VFKAGLNLSILQDESTLGGGIVEEAEDEDMLYQPSFVVNMQDSSFTRKPQGSHHQHSKTIDSGA